MSAVYFSKNHSACGKERQSFVHAKILHGSHQGVPAVGNLVGQHESSVRFENAQRFLDDREGKMNLIRQQGHCDNVERVVFRWNIVE